ncbi:NAD(P)/FAD-dependent oxidoreductase [Actinomadura litoris]|uniref:FAD-dependent oxidoreductase n=1 Tax=Actinomadura litoris TaxID=2678616 RepID=A0A7K1KU56_9ACTN|nr:FAD-binding oxidoreductase [Actinomadura litoris]MUN35718.1 FAD-dependent oxidoreductase [Actinomadura litoris]
MSGPGAAASADVAVVGGGIIGLAAAERLVAAGLSVVLIDAAGIADGPSGVSGGLVRAFDPGGGDRARAAAQGLAAYLRRGRHGRWPAVRRHGGLTLVPAGAGGALAGVRAGVLAGVEAARDAGHSAWVHDAAEIRERFPSLSVSPDLAGVYEPSAGWLPARAVARAMLRDAADGLTVLERVRATEVDIRGSRVRGVRTTAGPVAAPAVLIAAGVASADLALTAGVRLPLRSRSIGYCVFEPREAPGDLPAVVDTTTGAWLRRWSDEATGRGGVLAGVVSHVTGVPVTVTRGTPPAEQERVRAVVARRCPALADAGVCGGVMAHDALAPGGEGAVTAWPEPAGLVTATGWNGGAFKTAPVIGERAAARIREVIA